MLLHLNWNFEKSDISWSVSGEPVESGSAGETDMADWKSVEGGMSEGDWMMSLDGWGSVEDC